MNVFLETKNLTKKYGDFVANDNINISIKQGEIRAIVGENGAGKTTLMNMLYGQIKPSSGEIYVKGKPVKFKSPTDAINLGIGMVHQHFKLIPSFKVYENILLGTEILNHRLRFIVDHKKEMNVCKELIEKYGFNLDVNEKVENLSVGQQQQIEILKMLYRDVDLLILDEPTSVLTPQEIDELIAQLKDLKSQGKTIIIITHKLREVMEVSDNVTVIRKGKIIGTVKTKETNETELAQMMVGRNVMLTVKNNYKEVNEKNTLFEVRDLTTNDIYGKIVVDHVSFTIKGGEIYGIAGVEGNGQSELVKLLTGMMIATEGSVKLNGKDITNLTSDQLRKLGIGIIPEDRYAEGLCREMTLYENSIAGKIYNKEFYQKGILNKRKIKHYCKNLIKDYNVAVADIEGNVSQLSGGNAQKLIIGRELQSNPNLIIASQPTRGVDIGAIESIHRELINLRNQGKAILLVSSELTEIMNLSDRIGVMYKGRLVGEVDPKHTSETELGLMMAGTTREGIAL